jgi:predicted dehydrogenase
VAQTGEKVAQQGKRARMGIRSMWVGSEYPVAHHPSQQRHRHESEDQRQTQDDQLATQSGQAGEGAAQRQIQGRLLETAASRPSHSMNNNSLAMKKIRAAVIGVGYLGRFHAQKYAQAAGCELVAVVDASQDAREKVGAEVGARSVSDYRDLLGAVDAVSVVTPTPAHFPIARDFLVAGAHVLVEKPITETAAEARQLINLAVQHKRVLQVGHLERFNGAILAAEPYLRTPRFIECHRLAPYRERGTDVNVVLDLMIHDIDIVQNIVGAPIVSIDAVGTPVFSDEIDIANARIRFANGCVANATASRVSLKTERKLRIFEDDAYLSLDLQQKILTVIRKRSPADAPGPLPVTIEEQALEQGDALKAEIESFLQCIREGRAPVVSGEAGLMALETAMRITEQVHQSSAERRKGG